jgi:hypothetical protein
MELVAQAASTKLWPYVLWNKLREGLCVDDGNFELVMGQGTIELQLYIVDVSSAFCCAI